VIRPREARQVESGITVGITGAKSPNQFTLRWWHIPKGPASVVNHTVVVAGRIRIDIVKCAWVGVDRKGGRNAAIRIAIGRRPARRAWTCRGCVGGVAATICTAAATTAGIMPGALANHVGFH
jgi:hypothetical protein